MPGRQGAAVDRWIRVKETAGAAVVLVEPTGPPRTMKRRLRLRRQGDFQRILKARRVYVGQALVAFALPGAEGGWRIGVAVSRQLKGSVRRNRARRRVREAARLALLGKDSEAGLVGIPYDVVLIARPAALELPAAAIESEAAAVRARLQGVHGR